MASLLIAAADIGVATVLYLLDELVLAPSGSSQSGTAAFWQNRAFYVALLAILRGGVVGIFRLGGGVALLYTYAGSTIAYALVAELFAAGAWMGNGGSGLLQALLGACFHAANLAYLYVFLLDKPLAVAGRQRGRVKSRGSDFSPARGADESADDDESETAALLGAHDEEEEEEEDKDMGLIRQRRAGHKWAMHAPPAPSTPSVAQLPPPTLTPAPRSPYRARERAAENENEVNSSGIGRERTVSIQIDGEPPSKRSDGSTAATDRNAQPSSSSSYSLASIAAPDASPSLGASKKRYVPSPAPFP